MCCLFISWLKTILINILMFTQWSLHIWVKAATKMLSCSFGGSQTTNLQVLKSVMINVFSSFPKENEFITMQHTHFKAVQFPENRRIECEKCPQKSTQQQRKGFSITAFLLLIFSSFFQREVKRSEDGSGKGARRQRQ